jgi:hypothetical protein
MNTEVGMEIVELTIVTTAGVKTYMTGGMVREEEVWSIKKEPIYITGDPYDHYVGRNDEGEMLFSVNCLVPCDIEYS